MVERLAEVAALCHSCYVEKTQKRSFAHIARATERATAVYLWLQGYKIVGLNQQISGVEIDIIAVRKKEIVLVEVKWRRTPEQAVEALHFQQYQRLQRVAARLAQNGQTVRIDLAGWSLKPPFFQYVKNYRVD